MQVADVLERRDRGVDCAPKCCDSSVLRMQDAATRRRERLAMRNAVASKPRASLDGKPLAGHCGPTSGSNGRESFRSFFAALDMEPTPMSETDGAPVPATAVN